MFFRVLLVIAICNLWAMVGRTAETPNVIVILTDDQGYQDLGCFGSKTIKTPHIDRMAREGMRLTDFYAQAVCGPSRAALMTGCYPIRVAEPGNVKNQHTILHPQEMTIAELLKTRGYATACIGKWHLGQKQATGWNPATMPNGQGFDFFFGTPLFNGFTVRVGDTKFRSPLLRNQQVEVQEVRDWNSITQTYTHEAIQFIRRNRKQPFFVYLAHNMPHIPLGASAKFHGQSAYGPYGDAIEEIDWSTGEILKTLRELRLDHKTFVVFTSDNGPWIETTRGNQPSGKPFIPRKHSGSADPLRGYKMLTWEGGLRVPCVVWWPGKIPAGKTCREVAATIDLFPTIAALVNAQLPRDRKIDGKNLWPLLSGADGARSPHEGGGFFYYRFTALEAVRSGRWKLVLPRPEFPAWAGWSGRFQGSGVQQLSLFDLQADKGEARNLAGKNPEIVAQLLKKAEAARIDLGDYDRVGRGARFYDEGPARPRRWKGQPAKPVVYDQAKPVGNLCFQFEAGDLASWKVIEGEFKSPVTSRVGLPNHRQQPFNKQGRFLIFTGQRTDRQAGDDRQTGVLESPVFRLSGSRMSFLVGGGNGPKTYVALCDLSGRELRTASGHNSPVMRRVNWDVSKWTGQTLKLRIVDQSQAGWGHVTFDDFSCEGTVVPAKKAGCINDW